MKAAPALTAGAPSPALTAVQGGAGVPPELSDAALRAAAGDEVFDRGLAYFRRGAVRVTERGGDDADAPGIAGHVQGTQPYVAQLWIEPDGLHADCSCPHGESGHFCKHGVALALAWRLLLGGPVPTAAAPGSSPPAGPRRSAPTAAERRAALAAFLHAQPAPVLADKLLEWADAAVDVRRELHAWQQAAQAGDTPGELKPVLTRLLGTTREVLDEDDSLRYARQAARWCRCSKPRAAVALCVHALRRLFAALGRAADGDGAIATIGEAVAGELREALAAAGEQPAAFADTWLRLRLDDPVGLLGDPAFEHAMGAPARERYHRLLAETWRAQLDAHLAERAPKAPARGRLVPIGRWAVETRPPELTAVEALYRRHLQETGDVEGWLAVLRSDLETPPRQLRWIEALEQAGRPREALAAAEAAVKRFPGQPALEDALLRHYERDGWDAEALALRKRRFLAAPGVEGFQAVLQAGRAAGVDTAALRRELFDPLARREQATLDDLRRHRAHVGHADAPQGPDVTLRAAILMSEGALDEALALVEAPGHRGQPHLLQRIALALPPARRDAAVRLLRRAFEALMPLASSPYDEVLTLVRQIAERLPPAERADWLADLRARYKAKRNFIAGLPTATPQT